MEDVQMKNTFTKVSASTICPTGSTLDGDNWCKLYHGGGDEDKIPLPEKFDYDTTSGVQR